MTAWRRRPAACIWAVASGGSTWQLTKSASTVTTPISLSSAALSGCEDVPRRAPRVMAGGNDFEIGEGAVDGYLVVELRDLRAAASRGTRMGVSAGQSATWGSAGAVAWGRLPGQWGRRVRPYTRGGSPASLRRAGRGIGPA